MGGSIAAAFPGNKSTWHQSNIFHPDLLGGRPDQLWPLVLKKLNTVIDVMLNVSILDCRTSS